MKVQIECRTAHQNDLDTIAQVWHDSAASSDASPGVVPLAEFRARINIELADAWTLTVALVEGQIVGLLALKIADGVLDQLFVLPSAQRKGVGSLLLKQAMDAMPAGFTLRTASMNTGARSFYERMGLTLVSEGHHPRQGYPICWYGWNVR
ncbi:GNAT family N-acetyltransferase [Methylobacterium terrae]|uniref:GNAT family N-acetyltransferase n=1 Tax=Methylobacterium terrae TaxID=2202827 RepID=UPI0013A56A81|nr:GNAT family N-acetyltransferase [Methylobacterium terrae]